MTDLYAYTLIERNNKNLKSDASSIDFLMNEVKF